MEVNCYVCNKKTTEFKENLAEVKSVISNINISVFIEKFLNGHDSHRNVNDESNCICFECLEQISEYDVLCTQLLLKERRFCELLLATEKSQQKIEFESRTEQHLNIAQAISSLLGQNAEQTGDPMAVFNLWTLQKAEQNAAAKSMKRKHDTLISSSQPAAKKKSLRRSMDGKSKKIIANASMTEPLETIKLEDISFEINQNLTPPSTPEKEPEIELPPETNGKQPKSYSEAKIPCTICSKEYKSVGNLNRHMKIHTK